MIVSRLERVVDLLRYPLRVQREIRLMYRALALPVYERLAAAPALPVEPLLGQSRLCRQADFEQPWYAYWVRSIGEAHRYHRKQWEFVFICQTLYERGLLRPGARGLGFGVGLEPLPALFAHYGTSVLATDQAADAGRRSGWAKSHQHAANLEALRRPDIVDEETFSRQVSFRACDMNAVPPDLLDYDFCWSACALEHLGTIEKGLEFIERSVECLRPGGIAVHTTEYNLGPGDRTLTSGPTVLFRQSDFDELAQRLGSRGHTMLPIDLGSSEGPLDRYIDFPPYLPEPHLRLALAGYPASSVGIVVVKAS